MHYQHRYHAGNFADVFKHVLICGLLAALNRKDKPWCYLETHAGSGKYDLSAEAAARTGEYIDGIARIRGLRNAPEPLASFLRIVEQINLGNAPLVPPLPGVPAQPQRLSYPGSPLVARDFLRTHDRLVLCEKVPEIVEELRRALVGEAQAVVHLRDGYEAHSLLPPLEKRGLVLIDPAFEARDEFETIGDFLLKCQQRFASGIYAVWYPLKNRYESKRFLRRMHGELSQPAINFEFDTDAPGEGQMRACGMLVVNPPFQFGSEALPVLRILARELAQGPKSAALARWVRPEETK